MKRQKYPIRPKNSSKDGSALPLIWMVLLASKLATGKQVSRVERVRLYGGEQNGLDKKIGVFAGSLTESYTQRKETKMELNFDFKLLQQEDRVLKRSLRIKIEVDVDPKNLKEDSYTDSLDHLNQFRFFVQVFKNNPHYRGGVEPKSLIKNVEIKKLDFQAILEKNHKKLKKVTLKYLSLEIDFEKNLRGIGPGIKLNFTRTEKNTKQVYSGFWSWFLPLLFLYIIVYLLTSFASLVIVFLMSTAPINLNYGFQPDLRILSQGLQLFPKLRLLGLASIAFLYVSFWSTFFLVFLVILELIAQTLIWMIPLTMTGRIKDTVVYSLIFSMQETLYGPLVIIGLDFRALSTLPRGIGPAYKKQVLKILFGFFVVILAFIFPSILPYSHWILAFGACFCSFMVRYENPCFRDYVSWIAFFGFYTTFEFLHINCYLATAWKCSFLEGFFGGLMGLMASQWKSFLASQILMALGIFVDFFFIKSNILLLFSKAPKKQQLAISHTLTPIPANHQPGVLYFEETSRLVLVNPSLSGSYSNVRLNPNKFRLGYSKRLYGLSQQVVWEFRVRQSYIYQFQIVDRVLYQGKEQKHLIAVFKKDDSNKIEIKLFDLRTKGVVLSQKYKHLNPTIFLKVGLVGGPRLVQIRSDNHFLAFFDGIGINFGNVAWEKIGCHLPSVLDLASKKHITYDISSLDQKALGQAGDGMGNGLGSGLENGLGNGFGNGLFDPLKKKFFIKFNRSGNKAVSLSIVSHKNKRRPYQRGLVEQQHYTQILTLQVVDKECLDRGVIQPIFVDTSLLRKYYSQKTVRSVDFLDSSDELICLIFDDELLSVQIKEGELRRHFRIEISSVLEDVFLGVFKGKYVFGQDLEKNKFGGSNRLGLHNLGYIEKKRSLRLLGRETRMELRLKFGRMEKKGVLREVRTSW